MRKKSRGNGQGTAYKRKNTWTAQVIIGFHSNSRPGGAPIPIKRTKGGFATKKEALAYCPILLNGGIEKPVSAPRLSHYYATYKKGEYLQLSSSKQCAYRIAWDKLLRLHDVPVNLITVDLLRSTVADTADTYYKAKDCKNLLSNLFKLIGADGFASKDLPSYIVLPKLEEKERQPFSEEEQRALWRLYESGDILAALPLLMIYTGMMPGEAQRLRVEHIDLDARTITHAGMKTKVRKSTPMVIASSILPLVADLIANAQPSGYIFPHSEDIFYTNYYEALARAGCRRLPPYSCRHTTATALTITEGIAPQTVKLVMRWSSTKMLDRYAHPDTSDALTAVDAIKKSS